MLCTLHGSLYAEPASGSWTPPEELATAQDLSKLITSGQWYAALAGIAVLGVLLAVAYLVPLIRAPRWQILGFTVVPLIVAFATLDGLTRSAAGRLSALPYDELQKVVDSELAPAGERSLAAQVLAWRGEVHGRSFLLDIARLPLSATFLATAALLATVWLLSHHRVLRAS